MDAPWEDFKSSTTNDAPWEDFKEKPTIPEALGHAALNNLPFGGQIAALGKKFDLSNDKDYSENLSDWNKQTDIDKSAHPIAYGTGAVAGAVAPAFIAPETLAANPVLGNAALGVGNALSDKDLSKDLSGTAKEAAIGAGVGGALGKVGEFIGKGASALAPAGERLEANATANALNLGTFGVKRLAKGLENPEQVMLRVNKEVNEIIPDFIKLSDTAGSKFQKLSNAHEEAGNIIGRVVDTTSQKMGGQIPEANEAIEELEKAASKYSKLTSARNADARAELMDTVTRMKELQQTGGLNFRAIQDIKSDIGEAYNNPNFDNPGIDKAYAILSKKMDSILGRITVEDPSIKSTFDQSKKLYKLTSELLPAMKRGVAREVANTGGGLTNAALGAGAIFGHPITAGAGYAAKTAAHLAAPDFAANAIYKGINALKKTPLKIPANTGQGINQLVNDYLVSEFKKKRGQ